LEIGFGLSILKSGISLKKIANENTRNGAIKIL
jgi:hypothetical protein